MGSCKCQTSISSLSEDHPDFQETDVDDPTIVAYKTALKQLGVAIKSAHKTKEGKKLSADYWTDVVKMLKKAKLGISMMELGIDDESEISTTHDKSKETQSQPASEDPADTADAPPPAGGDTQSDEEGEEGDEKTKKLAAIGLKKESTISEESSSKSQQRLFGMVHAYNKGELKKGDVDADLYAKIKKIANGITKSDAEDMAKTDHDDLPEKVPTDEFYDVMNHLGILLSEHSFDTVECDGSEFNVEINGRTHTIEFDDKFYLSSPEYKFELGGTTDISEVVDTFVKLSRRTSTELKDDYKHELLS